MTILNPVKTQAMADYLNSSLKLTEIAKRHSIPLWKLKNWVRAGDAPRRPRGARALKEPTARAREILAYAGAHGFSKAASYFNVSKQLVSSLAKRWNVHPPKCSKGLKPDETSAKVKSKGRGRKPTRDVVVSFRLREDELSLLRAMQTLNTTPPPGSHHKLVRAVVLARLENPQVLERPTASAPQHYQLNGA
jgi:hypothetical protein